MARHLENDCVECPQGCIMCGRKETYLVYECDECGKESTDEDFLERVNGKEICSECYEMLYGEENKDARTYKD